MKINMQVIFSARKSHGWDTRLFITQCPSMKARYGHRKNRLHSCSMRGLLNIGCHTYSDIRRMDAIGKNTKVEVIFQVENIDKSTSLVKICTYTCNAAA